MFQNRNISVAVIIALISTVLLTSPTQADVTNNDCVLSGLTEGQDVSEPVLVGVTCPSYIYSVTPTGTRIELIEIDSSDTSRSYILAPFGAGSSSLSLQVSTYNDANFSVNLNNTISDPIIAYLSKKGRVWNPVTRPLIIETIARSKTSKVNYSDYVHTTVTCNSYDCNSGEEAATVGFGGTNATDFDSSTKEKVCAYLPDNTTFFDANGPVDVSARTCATFTFKKGKKVDLTVWRKGKKIYYRASGNSAKHIQLRQLKSTSWDCTFQVEIKKGSKWNTVKKKAWATGWVGNNHFDYLQGNFTSKSKVSLRAHYVGCKWKVKTKHTKIKKYKKHKEWVCYWGFCWYYRWKTPVYKTWYTTKKFSLPDVTGKPRKV